MDAAARAQWRSTWPEIIGAIAENWSLRVEPPFPNISFNFAAPAVRANGTRCVLKVCLPDHEFDSEVAALTVYDGRGAVRLLDVDRERRAMLLERAKPGAPILSLPDEESTRIAAEIMKRLWRPVPTGAPLQTLSIWGEGFQDHRERFNGAGPIDAELFQHGDRLFRELLASQAKPVVLHGDLHHYNLLSSGDGWIAIDPKGVIGEPAYEPANWLRNPYGLERWPDLGAALARRIDMFSEILEIERARIRDWAVAQTVLSACWCLEDDDPHWRIDIRIAEVLRAIPL
jgi:streptomycin 6-kinase